MSIQVFDSLQFGELRITTFDGEPWFVAKDVCNALELNNSRQALSRLDDDEKSTVILNDGTPGNPNFAVVNEAGLYALVMSSRKPEAKQFKRWVTHEVLPAIRHDGGYMVAKDETAEETMARAVVIAERTIARLRARNTRQLEQIEQMRPKVLFADAVAASQSSCLIGELAKMIRQNGFDIGQNRLFEWMRENGYLGKGGCNRNVPTQRAMDMGLFRIRETTVTHADGHITINRTPKVTGKGQSHFINKLIGDVEL